MGTPVNGTREEQQAYQRAANKRHRLKHPERHKVSQRRQQLRKYHLTPDLFDQLSAIQNYRCAICNVHSKLSVDHHHTLGYTRGLLCNSCNVGIGHLREDVGILRHAIYYLEGHC